MEFQEIVARLQAAVPGALVEAKSEGVVQPSVKVDPHRLRDAALVLRNDPDLRFDYLMCLSGMDLGKQALGVVYHLGSMGHGHKLVVRTEVPAAEPRVPTVSDIWPTANWHEREAYDLVGVVFTGHPDLRRILLPEDYPGHPLRKDFKVPEFYNGMKVPY